MPLPLIALTLVLHWVPSLTMGSRHLTEGNTHGWKYVHIYTEIRKIEMCIRRSPYFDNFQNKSNKKIVSISFCNLVWSIHPTTCRSMFSEANACARVAGSGENCCELAGSLLYTSEKSRAVRKNAVFVRGLWAFRCHWQKCKNKTNGSGFRRWTRSEYRFNIGVESLMSRGLQLKNYKIKTIKRRKELGSEVDIRSFFKKPCINWYS